MAAEDGRDGGVGQADERAEATGAHTQLATQRQHLLFFALRQASGGAMRAAAVIDQPGNPFLGPPVQPFVGRRSRDAQRSRRLLHAPALGLDPLHQQQPAQGRELGTWMSHESLLVWSKCLSLHTSIRGLSCVNNLFRHYS